MAAAPNKQSAGRGFETSVPSRHNGVNATEVKRIPQEYILEAIEPDQPRPKYWLWLLLFFLQFHLAAAALVACLLYLWYRNVGDLVWMYEYASQTSIDPVHRVWYYRHREVFMTAHQIGYVTAGLSLFFAMLVLVLATHRARSAIRAISVLAILLSGVWLVVFIYAAIVFHLARVHWTDWPTRFTVLLFTSLASLLTWFATSLLAVAESRTETVT